MKRFHIGAAMTTAMLAGACASGAPVGDRAALIYEPSVCVTQELDVYFDEGQARLTPPARDLIRMTGERLSGCHVERIDVIGLASATGGAARNLTLSERRAERVADALRDAGLPAPQFSLAAAGDAGALTETGLAEPLRRRTVVVVHARPR